MQIVIISLQEINPEILIAASYAERAVERMFTPFSFAAFKASSSGITFSAKMMQETSTRVETATILILDIIVIHALSGSALPITQLSRSPMYAPLISLSGEGRHTVLNPLSLIKLATVIKTYAFQVYLSLRLACISLQSSGQASFFITSSANALHVGAPQAPQSMPGRVDLKL